MATSIFRDSDNQITWGQALRWPYWKAVEYFWRAYRLFWECYYGAVIGFLDWRIERRKRKRRRPSPPPKSFLLALAIVICCACCVVEACRLRAWPTLAFALAVLALARARRAGE